MLGWLALAVQIPFAAGAYVLWNGAVGPFVLFLSALTCGDDDGVQACFIVLLLVNGLGMAFVWWAVLRLVALLLRVARADAAASARLRQVTFACCMGWACGVMVAWAMLFSTAPSAWLFRHLPSIAALVGGLVVMPHSRRAHP
jgi:hypothetical protein